jgi:hypothetical protein
MRREERELRRGIRFVVGDAVGDDDVMPLSKEHGIHLALSLSLSLFLVRVRWGTILG